MSNQKDNYVVKCIKNCAFDTKRG